jgi:ribosomal protein RSM22 (predicted rRNA methylase)
MMVMDDGENRVPVPDSLQTAIDSIVESLGMHQLIEAREELTRRYRQAENAQFMTTNAQRQAYVIARLPATYAAIQSALTAIEERATLPIKSMLDLGAGPGTGMWAACQKFAEIESITLIEKDAALSAIGKRLAQFSGQPAMHAAKWQEADLETLIDLSPHDFILLSYSVGELNPERIECLIDLCWQSTQQLLLIVEPGTPRGFERIRLIRRQLIDRGAHLIAPCPHHLACPMAGGDWCHFAARVERSSLHRRLKRGSLGYEDEKFSYVAATKTPFSLPASRILRQPLRHSGHVVLKLCTTQGVQRPTISKKMGDVYKQARKADWGDIFPFEPLPKI